MSVLVLALVFSLSTFAAQPEDPKRNFDVRDDRSKSSALVKERHLDRHGEKQKGKKEKVEQAMKKAEQRLAREIAGLHVQQSERTGAPEHVAVKHGAGKLARGASNDRERTLRKFLQDNAELFGLERNEVAQLVKNADYTNPAGNMGWVRLQKKIKGRNVFRGELSAAFSATGELVAVTGELPAAIDDADAKDEPLVSAAEAVVAAAASVGVAVSAADLQLKESDGNTFVFSGGPFADETKVELQYFPLDVGAVELAYSILLFVDEDEAYSFVVGAELPDVLYRKSIVDDQTQPATYRVYDGDSPAPLSPSTATPGSGIQGIGIPRTLFTLVSEGPSFNDLGWITDGGNTTTGNNVDAGLDLVSPDGIDA
ncbi:MAG TPA: hypothetical protein VF883_11280, partial [Thermoanaerobaculia bacterium]